MFFVFLLISLLKRLHILLIKTFTMQDVSMEIACKSAVNIASLRSVRQQAL